MVEKKITRENGINKKISLTNNKGEFQNESRTKF